MNSSILIQSKRGGEHTQKEVCPVHMGLSLQIHKCALGM